MKTLFRLLAVMLLPMTAIAAQFSGELSHSGSYSTGFDSMTLRGYIIDSTCAQAHVDNLVNAAMGHPTASSLKSVDAGLGVVSKGMWYPLDDKGTKKAT